jgi:hypothetical protein
MYLDYNNSDNWDDEEWQEHYRRMNHDKFLATPKGKQWEKKQKQEQFNENFKNFIIIVIIALILLASLIWGYHGSNDPYRR